LTKYIFCDLEATGNREKDRIIQLGLMVFEGDIDTSPIYMFNELNSTNADMMSEAMELHHITPEMLAGKKPLKQTEGFIDLVRLNLPENIFIAHDAPSDLKMLKREGFTCCMKVIDTLKCTKHLFPDLQVYRLQFLRYELELYKNEYTTDISLQAHDAISDAWITKILLDKLNRETSRKFCLEIGSKTIEKLIELSSMPVLLKYFQFGKYKGEEITEVIHSDYRYIEWMRNTLKLDEDMKYTLNYYLGY